MDDKEFKKLFDEMFSAVLAGYHATAQEADDAFERCRVMTEMALTAIKNSGYKLVRDAHRT